MGTERKSFLSAGLFMAIVLAVSAQSATLESAKKLYESKQFAECAKVLEKDAARPDAPLEMVRLAMQANLRAGNPISASIAAGEFLKRSKKPSLDSLFDAAEAARLAGDDTMALSRYHQFCIRPEASADARFMTAASYLIQRGSYPDVFILYAKKCGAASTQDAAFSYLSSLVQRRDCAGLGEFIPGFVEVYSGNPDAIRGMFDNINGSRNQLGGAQTPVLEALARCKYPKNTNFVALYDYMHNAYGILKLDDGQKASIGMKFVEANGVVPTRDHVFLLPSVQYINSLQDANAKKAAAKEFFSCYKPLLKTDDAESIQKFLIYVGNCDPKVFSFVKSETLVKLLNRYFELKNSPNNNPEAASILNSYSAFFKENKAKHVAFLKNTITTLNTDWAKFLFQNDIAGSESGAEKSNIRLWLEAAGDKDAQLIRSLSILSNLRECKFKTKYYNAVTALVSLGDYDPNWLGGDLGGINAKAADSIKAVMEGAKISGTSPRLKALVAAMGRNSTIKADPSFAALEKFAENGTASNPALAAAAAAFQMPTSQKDMPEFEKALDKFLRAFKGNVPAELKQAKNLEEYAAWRLLQINLYNMHNPEIAKNAVLRWLPRMKIFGGFMNDLLWRASWIEEAKKMDRKGGPFWTSLQYAIPALAAADESVKSFNYGPLAGIRINPEQKDISVMEPLYGKFINLSISYIMQNAAAWTVPFYLKQYESILTNSKAKLTTAELNRIFNNITQRMSQDKIEVPVAFVKNFLAKYLALAEAENKTALYEEYVILFQLTTAKNRVELIDFYAQNIAKRSPAERLRIVNVFFTFNSYPPYEEGMALIEKILKPMETAGFFKQKSGSVVNTQILDFLSRTAGDQKNSDAMKDSARAMRDALSDALLARNLISTTQSGYDSVLAARLEQFITGVKDNPVAIGDASMVIADALSRENQAHIGNSAAAAAWKALESSATPQIQYAFLTTTTSGTAAFHNEAKSNYMMQMSKLAKLIPGMVPVAKNDPAYNLFIALNLKKEGNALQAWALTREKLPLLAQRWKEFDFDFVLWALDMARTQKMFKEAVDLSQTLWLDEGKLTPEYAAQLALVKGDIYRDQKNYPVARLEYESLNNSKRCSGTPAGRMAKFRLVELLILTEDFSSARTMLERLTDSATQEDQAEAFYLLAKLEYASDTYEQTNDYLKEVFQRVHNHVEGRLLEATVKLKLGRVDDDAEVEIGTSKLAKIQTPGRPLILQIVDNNLGTVRGGKSLPVLVTTTNGKDREIMDLLPGASDLNKFSASIPTKLGKAIPGNGQLELNGDDIILYEIEPEFQKANNISRPQNSKEIRSAGKLYAASQPILSESAQDDIRFQREMALTSGGAFREFGKVIRPGNSIYIRVIDADMSKHVDSPDTVRVDLACNSGDELNGFVLTETGNCTGVFEGKVATGIPFPNVSVSSSPEGQDVNAVINSTKTGSWTSSPAVTERPQWIEVDTMSSSQFKTLRMEMPNPDGVKALRLYASLDNGDELLCSYPETETDKIRGGLTVRTADSQPARGKDFAALFKKTSEGTWAANPVTYRNVSKSRFRDRDGWVSTEMTGSFYVPENTSIELKFLQNPNDQQTCNVLLDKNLVLAGRMNAAGIMSTKILQLQKGVHQLTVYSSDYAKTSSVQLGMVKEDGSEVPLPAEWFDPSKSPELLEFLRPKGKIVKTKTGFDVTLDTEARYRRVRWQFDDFIGNQVEVKNISATNRDGKAILPVENDLTTGKRNQILEIAPADTITVKYDDERRIEDDKAILTDTLSSSFSDAEIQFMYEEVVLTEEGEPMSKMTEAVRIAKGDTVIVKVRDIDADQSEERETVSIEVSTSSGEKMTMQLLEAENRTHEPGTFSEVLKFGDETDASKNTIKLLPGDSVFAKYLDKENNKPGIPVERVAKLENSVTNRAEFIMYDAKSQLIEDKSPAAKAKIKMMRDKGDKRQDIKIFKETISAERIKNDPKNKEKVLVINSKTPLLFELVSPDCAKHSGSTVNVEVLTQTEIDAAKEEQREPAPLVVKAKLTDLAGLARSKGYQVTFPGISRSFGSSINSALNRGLFSGIVRLQLGSAGDEINDTVTNNDSYNLLNAGGNQDSEAFKIPTVIVSGSDKITLVCKDTDGKQIAKQSIQLRSDGELDLFDKNYLSPSHSVHLGQNFYVRVYDPDRDTTAERDSVTVKVSAKSGDKLDLKLSETLPHSGIFTNALKVDIKAKPLAGETETKKIEENLLWSTFGDKVTFEYVDQVPLSGDKPVTLAKEGEVVIGSDGAVAVFSKKFKDPEMAVKTNFLMAEALFEMAKSHKNMKDEAKEKLAQEEIAKGKRVLEEALRDYPDTTLKAQGDFLLANLAQQLENYNDAIGLYSSVLARYPESEYAVKSQFQKAVCLEKLKQFIPACEEYVKLTYLYPNDKLAADAKLRLANHYYKQKNYKSSASIFRKFAENHPDHPLASKGLMLAGYSAVKYEELKVETAKEMKTTYRPDYTLACSIFQELINSFPDDKLMKPEAMYWLGDLWFKAASEEMKAKSYQILQNLIWDFPETRWAKLARGRLAERPKD